MIFYWKQMALFLYWRAWSMATRLTRLLVILDAMLLITCEQMEFLCSSGKTRIQEMFHSASFDFPVGSRTCIYCHCDAYLTNDTALQRTGCFAAAEYPTASNCSQEL